MKMNKLAFLMVGFAAMALPAVAAEPTAVLSDLSGKVLVSHGEGFAAAGPEMLLSPGDRILVGEESFAVLTYKGCAVSFDKPAVVVVKGEDACDAGAQNSGILVQPTADVVAPAPFFIPPVAILSTVAIVGVTCAVGCKKIFGGNKNPVTP